jgi:adenylate cyclase
MIKNTGAALLHRDVSADRRRGLELLAQSRHMCLHGGFPRGELPVLDLYSAREKARRGDRDGAIPVIRKSVGELFVRGQIPYCTFSTGVLVETLLDRGADADVAEAERAIDRLAVTPTDEKLAIRDIWLLRLRALLAQVHRDEASYREYRDRYRDMAKTLGFEGHIAWAEAMP